MEISYQIRDFAELIIDGNTKRYSIPPKIGTHREVFQSLASDQKVKTAQGKELIGYVHGALVYRGNEWANQENIKFPSQNYLRFPAVLTIIPRRKEFGDLEGGILVDSDLEGQGIEKQTEVPKDFSDWTVLESGILVKNGRMFLPYDKWYQEQWNAKNGAVIALCGGVEGAEMLEKIAKDSKRSKKYLCRFDVNSIKTPEKRVPFLASYGNYRLDLDCDYLGGSKNGCGVGVF